MPAGGLIRKTYTMQVTENDTQSSLEAELSGQYGSLISGGAKGADTTSTRSNGAVRKRRGVRADFLTCLLLPSPMVLPRQARDNTTEGKRADKKGARVSSPQAMSSSFHAEGGDTSLWLSSDDLDTIQVRPDKNYQPTD